MSRQPETDEIAEERLLAMIREAYPIPPLSEELCQKLQAMTAAAIATEAESLRVAGDSPLRRLLRCGEWYAALTRGVINADPISTIGAFVAALGFVFGNWRLSVAILHFTALACASLHALAGLAEVISKRMRHRHDTESDAGEE